MYIVKIKEKREHTSMNVSGLVIRFVAFLLGFAAMACTDELGANSTGAGGGGEALVRLTITAPGSSLPKGGSTARMNEMDPEYVISDIQVLVFDQVAGTFLYQVSGQQIHTDEKNPQKTNFNVLLKTSEEPLKLVLVANAEQVLETYKISRGTPEHVVRTGLIDEFAGNYLENIPMYGEKELPFLDAKVVNTLSVTMLRAVARVDVEMDLDLATSRSFVMQSVHIYRAKNQLQVIPDVSALSASDALKVKSPSVPANAGTVAPYSKVATSYGQPGITQLYVPEAGEVDPSTHYNETTCVVVGGYYNGEEKLSYYRADFNSGETGHPYGQVLRNHRYHFKVKQVNGAGWETPDEAANNQATTIVVEIKTWEDFTMEMFTNGDNYLGIDSRELVFPYKEGLKKLVGVQSTVPYKVSWVDSGESTTLGGSPVSNEYFTAEVVQRLTDAGDVSYIKLTTRKENRTGQPFEAQLKVEWGTWVFYVKVSQDNYKQRATKSIRVFSAYAGVTGALGNALDDWSAPNGKTMRRKLSNRENFSSTGTVNYFSGFTFMQAPRASWTSTTNPASEDAAKFLVELYSSDVLYLANDNYCSHYTAGVILEWLEGSPNRVLVIGGDGNRTSPAFLLPEYNGQTGLLMRDIDWWYNQAIVGEMNHQTISTGETPRRLEYVSHTPETNDFFNGPFGVVDVSTPMALPDLIFGYARNVYSKDIIPLVHHAHLRENQPSIAVDKKRRIIYHGDASLFEVADATHMMTASHDINNDHDRFWANLWAWIAYQVIWGDNQLVENEW